MNTVYPSIKGDPNDIASLKSWTRRLVVFEMEESFTFNNTELDIESRIFEEVLSLRKFLGSNDCRFAYILHQLLPFVSENSPKNVSISSIRKGKKLKELHWISCATCIESSIRYLIVFANMILQIRHSIDWKNESLNWCPNNDIVFFQFNIHRKKPKFKQTSNKQRLVYKWKASVLSVYIT